MSLMIVSTTIVASAVKKLCSEEYDFSEEVAQAIADICITAITESQAQGETSAIISLRKMLNTIEGETYVN